MTVYKDLLELRKLEKEIRESMISFISVEDNEFKFVSTVWADDGGIGSFVGQQELIIKFSINGHPIICSLKISEEERLAAIQGNRNKDVLRFKVEKAITDGIMNYLKKQVDLISFTLNREEPK